MPASASSRPSPRVPVGVRRRRALLAAIGALLVVVALLVVACGGGKESAADTVSRAFGEGETVRSAQVDVRLALSGSASGGDQPLDVSVRGPYQANRNGHAAFDLALGLDGAPQGGADALGLLGVGGKTYLRLGGQPFAVSSAVVDELTPDDAKKGDGDGLSFSSLGINPRSWLQDPERVGDEERAGEDVTHVRAGVDVDRLGADLKKLLGKADKVAQTASQKKEASRAASTIDRLKKDIKAARIDVWAAEGEGALRRMKVDMTLTSGRIVLDFGLSKINDAVTITAPKDALPLEQLLQAMQQQGGDAKSGAGAASGSESGAESGAAGSPYEQCVTKAAGDVSKLQACVDLQE